MLVVKPASENLPWDGRILLVRVRLVPQTAAQAPGVLLSLAAHAALRGASSALLLHRSRGLGTGSLSGVRPLAVGGSWVHPLAVAPKSPASRGCRQVVVVAPFARRGPRLRVCHRVSRTGGATVQKWGAST